MKGIYNVEVGYIINVRRIYILWGGYKHYNKSRRTDHYRLDCFVFSMAYPFVFSMVYPFVFSMVYPVIADDL